MIDAFRFPSADVRHCNVYNAGASPLMVCVVHIVKLADHADIQGVVQYRKNPARLNSY